MSTVVVNRRKNNNVKIMKNVCLDFPDSITFKILANRFILTDFTKKKKNVNRIKLSYFYILS